MVSNLKVARERLGIELNAAAKAINATAQELSRWEAGEEPIPSLMLLRLAARYRLPAGLLLRSNGDDLDGIPNSTQTDVQGGDTPDESPDRIDAAVILFRTQLQAMRNGNLLPLDNDTIEFCVESLRGQLERDAGGDFADHPETATVANFTPRDRPDKSPRN